MEAEAYIWALYGLAPLGAVFVFILAWNMVAAPVRLERRAHMETRKRLDLDKKQAVGALRQENALLVGMLQQIGIMAGKTELGSSANGEFTRQPNGDQTCVGEIPAQPMKHGGEGHDVTFPAAFSETPTIYLVPDGVLRVVKGTGLSVVNVEGAAPQPVTYTAKRYAPSPAH